MTILSGNGDYERYNYNMPIVKKTIGNNKYLMFDYTTARGDRSTYFLQAIKLVAGGSTFSYVAGIIKKKKKLLWTPLTEKEIAAIEKRKKKQAEEKTEYKMPRFTIYKMENLKIAGFMDLWKAGL